MAAVITASVINAFSSDRASSKQADAAQNAANTQADANRYAADIQKQMFDKQIELQEPWRQAGITALNKLTPLASEYTKFGMAQFQQDPGYAFRLKEGQRALDQSAAARGGLISGNALKAAQRYGQEMGSQEYQNAFTRYLREREAQLNPLQSLAGVGQTTAQTMAGQAGQYGANVGNLASATGASSANALLAQGQARASAYGGYGQAAGQALQGLYNNWGGISNFFGGGSNNALGPSIGSNAYESQDAYAARLNALEGF
jgi:hypothetical protein